MKKFLLIDLKDPDKVAAKSWKKRRLNDWASVWKMLSGIYYARGAADFKWCLAVLLMIPYPFAADMAKRVLSGRDDFDIDLEENSLPYRNILLDHIYDKLMRFYNNGFDFGLKDYCEEEKLTPEVMEKIRKISDKLAYAELDKNFSELIGKEDLFEEYYSEHGLQTKCMFDVKWLSSTQAVQVKSWEGSDEAVNVTNLKNVKYRLRKAEMSDVECM